MLLVSLKLAVMRTSPNLGECGERICGRSSKTLEETGGTIHLLVNNCAHLFSLDAVRPDGVENFAACKAPTYYFVYYQVPGIV